MTDLLKRETSIADNRDPRGVQWGIFPQKGRSLYLVCATKKTPEGKVVEEPKYNVPTLCQGEWTHPDKAQEAIARYLTEAWDMSDAQATKNAGRKSIKEDAVVGTD